MPARLRSESLGENWRRIATIATVQGVAMSPRSTEMGLRGGPRGAFVCPSEFLHVDGGRTAADSRPRCRRGRTGRQWERQAYPSFVFLCVGADRDVKTVQIMADVGSAEWTSGGYR